MTRKDLMQIRILNNEIASWKKELLELEEESAIGSPAFDQPSAQAVGKVSSPTENRALKLAEKKEAIEELERKVEDKRIEIIQYLQTVDDSLLRQIILHRCIKGLSWRRTAIEIGGGNTEDGLRMIFNRAYPN